MASDRPKGYFTIRLAGFFFLASAVLAVATISSEVALLGAMRGGLVAAIYQIVYAAIFAVMGAGLWRLDRWAPSAILAGTIFYTVDQLVFLLGDRTLGYEELLAFVEPEMVQTAVLTATLTAVICWWGFVGYVFKRRDSFTN
jgi:hypothetical protein